MSVQVGSKPLSENRMALFNILSTVLVAGIGFFTIPIFTRMLDTEGYGIVSVYTAWVQICTIFIGLKADGSLGSAKANLPDDEQDAYQLSVLLMSLLSFVVALVFSLAFMGPLTRLLAMNQSLVVCMLMQGYGAFLVSFFNGRFIFRKQAQINFAISVGICVSTSVISVLLVLFVFTGDEGYMGRILGLTIPNLVLGLSLLAVLAWRHSSDGVKISYWRFCLTLTLPLILHSLSQLLLAQSDRVIIQRIQGNSMVGVYSIAVTVSQLLHTIYGALNNAFVPFMYDDLAGRTSEKTKQSHFRNYFHLFTLGTCAFSLMSPEVLRVMATESYWEALSILPMLVVGHYCVFLYSFPVNIEFYLMRTRSVAIGSTLAAIINVFLNFIMIPWWGMKGAAIATTLSYLGLFFFHFLIVRYTLGDRSYPTRVFIWGLSLVLLVSASYYPLSEYIILRWILGIAFLMLAIVRVLRTRSIF